VGVFLATLILVFVVLLVVARRLVGSVTMFRFGMDAVHDPGRTDGSVGFHEAYDIGFVDGNKGYWKRSDLRHLGCYNQGYLDGERTRSRMASGLVR
jgi:hypothetical protein